MNKISSLGEVFRLFEILGFQRFSLESVLVGRKKETTWRRVAKAIHITIIWVVISCSIALLGRGRFDLYRNSSESNKFSYLMNLVLFGISCSSIFVNLLTSKTRNARFVRIFENAENMMKLCDEGFGHRVSYEKLKQRMRIILAAFFVYFSICCILVCEENSVLSMSFGRFLLFLWLYLVNGIVSVALVKYNFYVQIVIFHLEALRDLLKQKILKPRESRWALICLIEVDQPFEPFDDVNAMLSVRKILIMIKSMVSEINKSMDFLLLLILATTFIRLVTSLFNFLLALNGNSSGDTWMCKNQATT